MYIYIDNTETSATFLMESSTHTHTPTPTQVCTHTHCLSPVFTEVQLYLNSNYITLLQ